MEFHSADRKWICRAVSFSMIFMAPPQHGHGQVAVGGVAVGVGERGPGIASASSRRQTAMDARAAGDPALPSRALPANIPPPKVFLRCDQAALVSCRLIALLRKAPYRDAAKKVAEFVQAGMIERTTAGTRHPHHA